MLEKVKEIAFKYGVKNAFIHEGKADVGAVVGKVKAMIPDIDLKKAMPIIQEAVKEINGMSKETLETEYKKFEEQGYELKPKDKQEGLPAIDWAEQKEKPMITRFAPNPTAPFHLGNARAAIISHEYARKYNGKFILRFDDTDPKVKKSRADAEEIFLRDLTWLGITVDETYFASDRLSTYYHYMRELIKLGKMYACTCETEKWKQLIDNKQGCPCRDLEPEKVEKLFEQMLSHELKEGQIVLRMKTDLLHNDPSIRDWWVAKIVDNPEHPRVGSTYKVWPSYNFASAIDDHELGITLIARGQEHAQNGTKQKYLYDYLGWEYPAEIYFGRVKLQGVILSKSQMEKGIQEGLYTGHDDPRLGTIQAFRRRGFRPEALKDVIIFIGIKSSDTTLEWNFISSENKKYIEKEAVLITFLEQPVNLHVDFSPEKTVELNEGMYDLKQGHQSFLVDRKEIEKYGVGKIVRLKQAYNVRIKSMDPFEVHSEYVADIKIKETIPWLLEENAVDVQIVMPDNSRLVGSAETRILEQKVGQIVHLERLGFGRLDSLEGNQPIVWFTHK
ncbi:MAG: glutamate--tRNA ligase [Candidatus Diapherotrites archaeon]|nr:glutamate--tRNA ligase [Candidatus Diapherotrites archaeon]